MRARAWIELPRDYGWGPTRVLSTQLTDLGYVATEIRFADHIYLALTGERPDRAGEMRLLNVPGQ
jgi:hypothetical protein